MDIKRRDNPFGFDDEFLDKMMKDMERAIDSIASNPDIKSFIRGFSMHTGPDGIPIIQEFGNRPISRRNGTVSDEREPITDIVEGKEDISVTVEIPGVEKKDIILNTKERVLSINVDNQKRKYSKRIEFLYDVLPKSTKATYKNGVLDVVITRKKKIDNTGFSANVE